MAIVVENVMIQAIDKLYCYSLFFITETCLLVGFILQFYVNF